MQIKRDERASSLVPGSVTKQVVRIQPLRVETLVTLILETLGPFVTALDGWPLRIDEFVYFPIKRGIRNESLAQATVLG